MQFSIIPVLAFLAAGAFAMPSEPVEARSGELEARVNCGQILPACAGGSVRGQTNCRCSGQAETCDLWTCPGGPPNVVSFSPKPVLFPGYLPQFILQKKEKREDKADMTIYSQMVCGQRGTGCVWI